jgi:hypothetical protein
MSRRNESALSRSTSVVHQLIGSIAKMKRRAATLGLLWPSHFVEIAFMHVTILQGIARGDVAAPHLRLW